VKQRDFTVSEIQRLAAEAGGLVPSLPEFSARTGILDTEWRGRYLDLWLDAQKEAGFTPRFSSADFETTNASTLANSSASAAAIESTDAVSLKHQAQAIKTLMPAASLGSGKPIYQRAIPAAEGR